MLHRKAEEVSSFHKEMVQTFTTFNPPKNPCSLARLIRLVGSTNFNQKHF